MNLPLGFQSSELQAASIIAAGQLVASSKPGLVNTQSPIPKQVAVVAMDILLAFADEYQARSERIRNQ